MSRSDNGLTAAKREYRPLRQWPPEAAGPWHGLVRDGPSGRQTSAPGNLPVGLLVARRKRSGRDVHPTIPLRLRPHARCQALQPPDGPYLGVLARPGFAAAAGRTGSQITLSTYTTPGPSARADMTIRSRRWNLAEPWGISKVCAA